MIRTAGRFLLREWNALPTWVRPFSTGQPIAASTQSSAMWKRIALATMISRKKSVLDGDERQARFAALMESLLYSFVQPMGAMRNTQNPHIVDVTGTLTYSTAAAPAPLVSPLNPDFVDQTKDIAASLNRIHDGRVHVEGYDSLASLANVMQGLLNECQPYESAR